MPPPPLTRTVGLPKRLLFPHTSGRLGLPLHKERSSASLTSSSSSSPGLPHSSHSSSSSSYESSDVYDLDLLRYPAALAQPGASVPLLSPGAATSEGSRTATMLTPRRWIREAEELCVASIRRSENINHINRYVATYKLSDPQWQPLLLPEVHVLSTKRNDGKTSASSPPAPPHATPPPSSGLSEAEVFINHNKLGSLELMSRHANYALRHLVQRGHAMYFITVSQHSILQMRGVVEASYVTCAYGVKGERLRTHIQHVGPLDVRDVLHVDPRSGSVSFDWKRPHIRRGVVALSVVEGYGTWFQRKPMLWQRSRRIGALQAQLGAFQYQLAAPTSVGRLADYEVSLLEPHLQLNSGAGGGGGTAVGIIASSQVAANEKLYLGQFEAPVIAAMDSVHQLAHRSALHHQLVHPTPPAETHSQGEANTPENADRQALRMEQFLPVSWTVRTPPPYVPLEADLPFKLQLSRPAVFSSRHDPNGSLPDGTAVPFTSCGGSTIGTPFVDGVPVTMMEFLLHQGVDHYVFDDSPSSRPMKWWNQKSNMPYNGYLYCMRSGLLDAVRPSEQMSNPLAPTGPHSSAAAAVPSLPEAAVVPSAVSGIPAERVSPESGYLQGHLDEDLETTQTSLVQEKQRLPLSLLVPPTKKAKRRMRRYRRALQREAALQKQRSSAGLTDYPRESVAAEPGATSDAVVVERVKRKRRKRQE